LADLLRLNHRNAEAAVEYTTYLRSKPEDPMGHLGAALNLLDQGKLIESAQGIDQALVLSPHDSVILGARALVEIQLGRMDRAQKYLDRAVELDPFNYRHHYQRMLVLTKQGKKAEADAEQEVMDRIRRDEVEFAKISQQLAIRPLDLKLRRQAASWLMNHGHEAEAVSWAKLVLESVPADPEMNRLLAEYYRKIGKTGLANYHEAHSLPIP
jgi:predicted Zn-dependent protease